MATRKQKVAELTAPDPFLDNANKIAAWVEKRLKKIAIGGVALAVLVAVGLMIGQQRERSASAITADLTDAMDGYRDATNPTPPTDTATTAPTASDKAKDALPPYEELIAKEPGHGAAVLARLYAGDLARRAGDHAKAAEHFEAYLKATRSSDTLRFFAQEGLGYALEEQGKNEEALTAFAGLLELPKGFYKDYGYKHTARIHEQLGNNDKAIEAYKAIVDDLSDSKLRDFAEEQIKRLE